MGTPSSNVDGRFCDVHGAGGLELDEQPPVAGGRESGLDAQGGAAVITVDRAAGVKVRECEVSGTDGGDVSVGLEVWLQVCDRLTIDAEI